MSIETMKKRMTFAGGDADGRNAQGKLKSMLGALKNSYQAEWVTLNEDDEENKSRWRCLINPDKLKEDYDQKEISIQFESNLKEGDVFLWDRTNTHWIVYLQEYSEEAYFRASIRRCDYQIDINGRNYWIYMRGPVETTVQWNQKHQLYFNDLNYTIIMYIPKNEETSSFFERHKIIKFDNHNWKVNAVDRYSQKGIIEVVLGEAFDNDIEDLKVVPEVINPDEAIPHISGPQFVKPFDENLSYVIKNASNGKFVVNSSKVKINHATEQSCDITILTGKSSSFDLIYRIDDNDDIVLPITIESF
jgi:hypothetical protein